MKPIFECNYRFLLIENMKNDTYFYYEVKIHDTTCDVINYTQMQNTFNLPGVTNDLEQGSLIKDSE